MAPSDDFHLIPRFKTARDDKDGDDADPSWIWANCNRGDDDAQAKYPLLARLNIPLGMTEVDANCRGNILAHLLAFNEQQLGLKRHKIVESNGRNQYVIKLPCLKENAQNDNLKRSGVVETILESLTVNEVPDQAADMLCTYLAKHHNANFVKAMELAQEIEKKNKKKEPFVAPEDLIMYDGGSRDDPLHVNWNLRYRELLAYKERHGDCLVPSHKSKEHNEEDAALSKWVRLQRSAKKENRPSLTPKRLELLEQVGFVWVVNPTYFRSADDPRIHRAIAAKLYFQQNLTAREAMLMSGFPDEEASDDSRKKLLNDRVCNFYKKDFQIKSAVQEVLKKLQEYCPRNEDGTIESVFGSSDIAATLKEQGKLIPRDDDDREEDDESPPPPAKKQRTEEETSNESNNNIILRPLARTGGATTDSRKRPPLPLTRDYSWL